MYADDTTVFCIGPSQDIACKLLNCALEELFTCMWSVNNRLAPSPGKCEVMPTFQSSAYWSTADWQLHF